MGPVTATEQPSTLKTNIGKAFVEKAIPGRATKDRILKVTGIITGRSQDAGTLAAAIETDRAALIALDDGYLHAYNDGRHSGNFVIRTGSLEWDDQADIQAGAPRKFVMELVEWT